MLHLMLFQNQEGTKNPPIADDVSRISLSHVLTGLLHGKDPFQNTARHKLLFSLASNPLLLNRMYHSTEGDSQEMLRHLCSLHARTRLVLWSLSGTPRCLDSEDASPTALGSQASWWGASKP